MKKALLTILILTLLTNLLFLAGCGNNGKQQETEVSEAPDNSSDFVLCSDKSFILTNDDYKIAFNIKSERNNINLFCDDKEIEHFYDDGESGKHGDINKDDGVFSAMITLNENKVGNHVFYAESEGKKSNTVTVEVKEQIPDSEYENIEKTNTLIQETVAEPNFYKLSVDKRKETSDKKLQELVGNGFIMKNSVNYSEESKTYGFRYSNGVLGFLEIGDSIDSNGILLGENNFLIPQNGVTAFKNALPHSSPLTANANNEQDSVVNSKRVIENKALLIFDYVVRGETLSQNGNEYSFEPVYSIFENKANEWESNSLEIETSVNPSVESYKTSFRNNGIVILCAHGTRVSPGWFQADKSVICVNEKCTKSNNKKYERDLSKNLIACSANNSCYAIFPEFFSEYYSQSRLSDTVMLLGNCFAFGTDENVDYTLSDILQYIGASSVIGSVNEGYVSTSENSQSYSIDLLFNTLDLMLDGKSVADSFTTSQNRLGNNFDEYCQKYFTEYYAGCDEQSHQDNRNHYSVIRTNSNIEYYLEKTRPMKVDLNNSPNAHEITAFDLIEKSSSEIIEIMGGDFECKMDEDSVGFVYSGFGSSGVLWIYNEKMLPGFAFHPEEESYNYEFQHRKANLEIDYDSIKNKLKSGNYNFVGVTIRGNKKLNTQISADMTYSEIASVIGDFEIHCAAQGAFSYHSTIDGKNIGFFFEPSEELYVAARNNGLVVSADTMRQLNPKLENIVIRNE